MVTDEAAALKALIEKSSSLRTIGDFDVTRDGKIDSADIAAIDGIYGRAKVLAEARHIDPTVNAGLYNGQNPFALGDDLSLSSVADNNAVSAFVIESLCLLDQARFAAVVSWEPDALIVRGAGPAYPWLQLREHEPADLVLGRRFARHAVVQARPAARCSGHRSRLHDVARRSVQHLPRRHRREAPSAS